MEKRLVTIHLGDGSPIVTVTTKRNDKCACGSGKKQKKCCGVKTAFYSTKPKPRPVFKTDGDGNEYELRT